MRGSVIQRILRVAAEVHSSETRNNPEWQTKFPSVVMKAEQILYSKANSEDEYMNPDTLMERLNDAIDTIIRRDKSTETGQCIRPCIEAALVIGCVPVRESRSQQLKNPRRYLALKSEQPAQAAQPIAEKTNNHRAPPRPPIHPNSQLTKSTKANLAGISSPFGIQMASNTSRVATHSGPDLQPNFTQTMASRTTEPDTCLNFGSVHPLYYGGQSPNVESRIELLTQQDFTLRNILFGKPVGWPPKQPVYATSTMNLLPGDSADITSSYLGQAEPIDRPGKAAVEDCDLSLRLGGPLDLNGVTEKELAHVSEDGWSSSQQESGEHLSKNLEFCFFPTSSASDPSESGDNEVENESTSETSRKRRTPDHQVLDARSIHWLKDLRTGQLDGENGWLGL